MRACRAYTLVSTYQRRTNIYTLYRIHTNVYKKCVRGCGGKRTKAKTNKFLFYFPIIDVRHGTRQKERSFLAYEIILNGFFVSSQINIVNKHFCCMLQGRRIWHRPLWCKKVKQRMTQMHICWSNLISRNVVCLLQRKATLYLLHTYPCA